MTDERPLSPDGMKMPTSPFANGKDLMVWTTPDGRLGVSECPLVYVPSRDRYELVVGVIYSSNGLPQEVVLARSATDQDIVPFEEVDPAREHAEKPT